MNEESTGLVMAELKCELCDATITETPCPNCQLLTRDDLIEAAHRALELSKRLLIACVLSNGSSIFLAPQHLINASDMRLLITATPFRNVRLDVVTEK